MLNLVKYEGRYDEKTKGKEKTVGQNSVKLYFLTDGWILVKLRLNVAREVLLYFRGHHLTSYFNTLYGRMRYYFTGDPFSEKVLSAL